MWRRLTELAANDNTDAKKKCFILLTVCGDSTFTLSRSLVLDSKLCVNVVKYNSLATLLKAYYKEKQSVIVSISILGQEMPWSQLQNTFLPWENWQYVATD